jgi:hypothetical protein
MIQGFQSILVCRYDELSAPACVLFVSSCFSYWHVFALNKKPGVIRDSDSDGFELLMTGFSGVGNVPVTWV